MDLPGYVGYKWNVPRQILIELEREDERLEELRERWLLHYLADAEEQPNTCGRLYLTADSAVEPRKGAA